MPEGRAYGGQMMTCCSALASAGDDCDVPTLEERDASVLTALAREGDGTVAFQGLKRRLDLHQQALTRTLKRLERDGYVAKDESGYRLTDNGYCALRGTRVAEAPKETLSLVHALLPPAVTGAGVAALLERRWFRGLRWYARSDGPDESTLTWLVDGSDAAVRLRVGNGQVTLEAEVDEAAPERVYAAARGVLAALAQAYEPTTAPALDAPVTALDTVRAFGS